MPVWNIKKKKIYIYIYIYTNRVTIIPVELQSC